MTYDNKVTDVTRETYTIYDWKNRQDIKVRCIFGSYEKSGTLRVRLYRETPGKRPGTFSTLYKEFTVEENDSPCLDINGQFLTEMDSEYYKDWLRSNDIANLTGIADVAEEGFIEGYAFNLPPDIYRRVFLDRMEKSGRDANLRLHYPMRFRSRNIPDGSVPEMRTSLRKRLNSILKARYPRTLLCIHKKLWESGYVHPLLECYKHGAFRAKDVSSLTLEDIYISLGSDMPSSLKEHMKTRRYHGNHGERAVEGYRKILEMAVRELIQQIDDKFIDRTAISDYIMNQNELINDITFNKKRLKTMSAFRFRYQEAGQPGSTRMIVLEESNGMYTPVVPVAWENPEWKGEKKDIWRALADPDKTFLIRKDKEYGSIKVTRTGYRKN